MWGGAIKHAVGLLGEDLIVINEGHSSGSLVSC